MVLSAYSACTCGTTTRGQKVHELLRPRSSHMEKAARRMILSFDNLKITILQSLNSIASKQSAEHNASAAHTSMCSSQDHSLFCKIQIMAPTAHGTLTCILVMKKVCPVQVLGKIGKQLMKLGRFLNNVGFYEADGEHVDSRVNLADVPSIRCLIENRRNITCSHSERRTSTPVDCSFGTLTTRSCMPILKSVIVPYDGCTPRPVRCCCVEKRLGVQNRVMIEESHSLDEPAQSEMGSLVLCMLQP